MSNAEHSAFRIPRSAFLIGMARIVSRGVTEIDHVAVEDDVFLALETELGVIAAGRERASRQQVFVAADFRADEPALDVGVDLSRRVLRARAARDRPRAILVVADREKRD